MFFAVATGAGYRTLRKELTIAANGNRVDPFQGAGKMELRTFDFPKLVTPAGKKANHGAILKIVTTNICGSDQHIYHGRFSAPKGMVMGHEMTGEVIEVGPSR